jgi:hypothetical protein
LLNPCFELQARDTEITLSVHMHSTEIKQLLCPFLLEAKVLLSKGYARAPSQKSSIDPCLDVSYRDVTVRPKCTMKQATHAEMFVVEKELSHLEHKSRTLGFLVTTVEDWLVLVLMRVRQMTYPNSKCLHRLSAN